MREKAVSKESFMLKYCLDRYNTQEVFEKVVDAFLPLSKFVPYWFVPYWFVKKLL